MEKTAMQAAIELIRLQAEYYTKSVSLIMQIKAEALFDAINALNSILPTERRQIEEAYDEGRSDGEFTEGHDCIQFKDAQDYFTTKYGK